MLRPAMSRPGLSIFDFTLDGAAQSREQQPQVEFDAHPVLPDLDPPVRALALEDQGIALPVMAQFVLPGQALGQLLGFGPRGLATEAVGTFNGNSGHGAAPDDPGVRP